MTMMEMNKMRLSEYPPILKELLACHETLRKLGFNPDELFVAVMKDNKLGVEIQFRGERILIGMSPKCQEDLDISKTLDMWKSIVNQWNAPETDESEREEMYYGTEITKVRVRLAESLITNGLKIPVIRGN